MGPTDTRNRFLRVVLVLYDGYDHSITICWSHQFLDIAQRYDGAPSDSAPSGGGASANPIDADTIFVTYYQLVCSALG